MDVRITAAQTIPYRAPKTVIQNMLSESNLMYSYLYTVLFLEWDIEHFLLAWKTSTAEIWVDGEIRIGVTTMSDVA